MLIVKVFVNTQQIDEIRVQNIRPHLTAKGWYYYRIIKPGGIEHEFLHKRSDGYRLLLAKVLNWFVRHGEEKKSSKEGR